MSETTHGESQESRGKNPERKSILLSKTFWLQVLALAAALYPPVGAWISANPVDSVAVFAAANVLVRFATSGRVNVFGENVTPPAGGLMAIMGLGTAAGVMGFCLPSCSPVAGVNSRGWPVRFQVTGPHASASYSPTTGLLIEAVVSGGK